MDPDLSKLIDHIVACNASLKGAADQYVNGMLAMKAAAIKCQSDFEEKKSKANAEIDRMRAEMKSLSDERAYLERTISNLRDQQERVRKSIERDKAKLRGDLDAFLARQVA